MPPKTTEKTKRAVLKSLTAPGVVIQPPPDFDQMQASMIMFISGYSGVIDGTLAEIFARLPCEYPTLRHDELPVGPDGTIVGKGFASTRVGALKIGRSDRCFNNIVSIDISALGGNINLKLSKTNHIQGSGARTPEQAAVAVRFLIAHLNAIPEQTAIGAPGPITCGPMRIERANYNFQLGYRLNLARVSDVLDHYKGLRVVYDNTLDIPLTAARLVEDHELIVSQRSEKSKKSKPPTILITVRTSGKIQISGISVGEIRELYYDFLTCVNQHQNEIRI